MTAANPTSSYDPLDLPDPVRWEPWKDSTQPHLFRGVVVKKYQQHSDYDPVDPLKNFVDVLDDDGEHVWTLSGFATRVHNELGRVNPDEGERIGAKFLGMKERKLDKKQYPDLLVVAYDRDKSKSSVQFKTSDDDSEPPAADDVPIDAGDLPEPPAPAADDDEPIPF